MNVALMTIHTVAIIAAVCYSVWFQLSKEVRDERGQKILALSYSSVFPLLLPAWLLIDNFYTSSLGSYKMAMWLMVSTVYMLHAVVIFIARRRL